MDEIKRAMLEDQEAERRLTDAGVLLMQGDCLELLKDIPDGSVDMVLADLPYGTTQNEWDCCIPLSALWAEYKRVIRTGGAVALFAQTPFDKVLGASNIEWLRYEFCWNKTRATGHLNANKRPLKAHENILVFFQTFSDTYDTTDYFSGLKDYMISEYEKAGLDSKSVYQLLGTYMASHYFTRKTQFSIPTESAYKRLQTTGFFSRPYSEIKEEYDAERQAINKEINIYNPQGIKRKETPTIRIGRDNGTNYGKSDKDALQEYENYPKDILAFPSEPHPIHPTQKPVTLLEYLIRTYTNKGETVLDNTMGSGSTGVACVNTGRKFIGMELDPGYFEMAKQRIEEAQAQARLAWNTCAPILSSREMEMLEGME